MENEAKALALVVLLTYQELQEDWVELWKIPWYIRYELPGVADDRVMEGSRIVLEVLLSDTNITFGNFSGDGAVFAAWDTDDPVPQIMAAWRALGRDPYMGEIGWLDLSLDSLNPGASN